MSNINICIDGKNMPVPRDAYVKSKTKQLRGFGYPTLTEETVGRELDAILDGKELGDGLTVIGGFMQDDIVLPKSKK